MASELVVAARTRRSGAKHFGFFFHTRGLEQGRSRHLQTLCGFSWSGSDLLPVSEIRLQLSNKCYNHRFHRSAKNQKRLSFMARKKHLEALAVISSPVFQSSTLQATGINDQTHTSRFNGPRER